MQLASSNLCTSTGIKLPVLRRSWSIADLQPRGEQCRVATGKRAVAVPRARYNYIMPKQDYVLGGYYCIRFLSSKVFNFRY